jgi:hypothetical protein
MDLTPLDISVEEAHEKLDEYQRSPVTERTAEDEAIAAGYRAAARGLPVISLPRTIAAGGFHSSGLPKMAVIGAEARVCFARWDGSALLFADCDEWHVNRGALVNAHSVRVPLAGDDLPDFTRAWGRGKTIVPLVPPRHRLHPRRMRRCHILWEVEEWTMAPPRDPALLRHLRGDLWSVLSVWDLTDLERMVLTQRASSR